MSLVSEKESFQDSEIIFKEGTENTVRPQLRRKDPRVPKVMALIFKSNGALINAFSGNLSASGLFIKTTQPIAKGEHFTLKLQLPDNSEALTIRCKVAWNRTPEESLSGRSLGMGVQFTDISPEDHRRLKEEITRTVQMGSHKEAGSLTFVSERDDCKT